MRDPVKTERVALPTIEKQKQAPELQLHAAATLIVHGDLFAKSPSDRQDKAGEIAQFCVPIDARFVGRLKRHHIDEAFEALKQSVLIKLRAHGVMSSGE